MQGQMFATELSGSCLWLLSDDRPRCSVNAAKKQDEGQEAEYQSCFTKFAIPFPSM